MNNASTIISRFQITLDNTSLDRILTDRLQVSDPTFAQANQLVAQVMSATTSTLRFPTHSNTSLASIVSNLTPNNLCRFISPAYEPMAVINQGVPRTNKTTVAGVLRRLVLPHNWMTDAGTGGKYVSLVHLLQGEVKLYDVHNAIHRFNSRNMIDWIPGPYSFYSVMFRTILY